MAIVGTVAALCSMSSFGPQIAKIWRERDASTVSLRMYLVTVTETLIGRLFVDGWATGETQLVSHSHWSQRQEIMLLMRPFGWLKGERGTATLVPVGREFEWLTAQWSGK